MFWKLLFSYQRLQGRRGAFKCSSLQASKLFFSSNSKTFLFSKLLNSSFLQISKHFFSGNFKTFLFSKLQNSSFLQIPKHFSILQLTLSRSLELKLQNCKFPKNFFIFHSTIAADWAKAQKFECNHCCMQFKNEFLGEKKVPKHSGLAGGGLKFWGQIFILFFLLHMAFLHA